MGTGLRDKVDTRALLTAILREDHFSNGSFERRQRAGQVDEILKRMVAELNK